MKLSQLDPNLVLGLFTIVTTLGGWLYAKVKGQKQQSLGDTVWEILQGVAIKLAESDQSIDVIRTKLTAAAYEGLKRMGIKPTPLVDLAISMAVEKGVTEVRKLVLERKTREAELALANAKLQTAVAALTTQAGAVLDAFKPTGTIPSLTSGGEISVEIVAP